MKNSLLPLLVLFCNIAWCILHCPRTVELPTPPDNFMDLDDEDNRGAGGYLFQTLLKDDPLNVEQPEIGRTYAFFAFIPGTALEDFCNGGAQ